MSGADESRRADADRRFLEGFQPGPESECWLWRKPLNGDGYGYVWDGGKQQRAHRYSYGFHCGPVPEGLNVLHTCDRRDCVNPNHLYPGTQKDNVRDAVDRGRWPRGKGSNPRKFSERDAVVALGMRLLGRKLREIADAHGCSRAAVTYCLAGKTWPDALEREYERWEAAGRPGAEGEGD